MNTHSLQGFTWYFKKKLLKITKIPVIWKTVLYVKIILCDFSLPPKIIIQ